MSVTSDGVPRQGVPEGEPYQRVPEGEPRQGVPEGEPRQGVPEGEPYQRVPEGEPNQGVPEGAPNQGVPQPMLPAPSPSRAQPAAATPGAPPAGPHDSAPTAAPARDLRVAAQPVPPARRWRRRVVRASLAAVPLALLLGFLAFVQAAIAPVMRTPGETDGIVVLTGGSERVATGLRLLAEGQARRLLISGAHPEAGLAEIASAAGIDPAPFAGRVAVGHAAATTRGNAVEAAAWARSEEMRSLRIVTAGYHMPRAMVELRRAMPGMPLVAHPVPSAALRAPGALWRPRVWALLAGEYARYLGAWAGLSGAFVPRRETHAT
ncbi:YdcF family protein [Roseomonas sp. CECT 9278]|uniref:YdcF family protein n=1 Tax=Roseomonas sp. CECT 9278 TaxID=2845823 RepID=UPI001E5DD209|nr:YdcF family protein [Roseomonas sp. CECT 9278]CAH0143851.1 hypothetical protein ROS9278_00544 [Roseomonas sp. CECT 9278]